MSAMTPGAAHAVYDVLEQHAGANSSWGRADFVYHQTTRHVPEYRFGGSLGYGGKFRVDDGRWYVDCYPEDETEERRRAIEQTNRVLERVQAHHAGERA